MSACKPLALIIQESAWGNSEAVRYYGRAVENLQHPTADGTAVLAPRSSSRNKLNPTEACIAFWTGDVSLLHAGICDGWCGKPIKNDRRRSRNFTMATGLAPVSRWAGMPIPPVGAEAKPFHLERSQLQHASRPVLLR